MQYCETEASTQTKVEFKATTVYDVYNGAPTAAAGFGIKYTWYAVKADSNGNFPSIDDTKENLTGADSLHTSIVTSVTNNFSPSIATIGKYKFFVEVEYALKARDYDGAETNTTRKRTYALYRGWVGGTDQLSASVVVVTPAPGKPHITIESVND